jgi:hypothetical protein
VDDDALDPDAALAGLVEGAEHDPRHGVVEVGVGIDDHGGVAAQLEHDLLLAGAGLEVPAHLRRAGEAQQLEAVVGGEEARPVAALADDERSHRSQARGLEHEGAARRDRRRHLVGSEVEGEVERRDERARADRHALPHPRVSVRPRTDVQRHHLAANPD